MYRHAPAVTLFLWKSERLEPPVSELRVVRFDVVGVVGWRCCFFFTHYEKNKYSFVRFVPPPQRYLERLPHFDIAAVFALSVQMLLFL